MKQYRVYFTYMFGRALWGSYDTANEAFHEAAKCGRRYKHVEIVEG